MSSSRANPGKAQIVPSSKQASSFRRIIFPSHKRRCLTVINFPNFHHRRQDCWSEQKLGVQASAHGSVTPMSSADCASLAPPRIKITFNGFTALEVQFVTPASASALFVLFEHDRSRLGPLAVTFVGTARREARV